MVSFPERIWYRRAGLAALALAPLAWLYGGVAALRRAAFRSGLVARARLAVPVVVVGNLVAGGTGKTPLVLALVERLCAAGFHPAVVSRGYGGAARQPRAVSASASAHEVGDEPLLLARRGGVPVWVGHDRAAAARALLARHPDRDVIVADDGLQHYRLERDLEIAVVDGRGFGNGRLLPAGPLREPVSRLALVDAVVTHGEAPLAGYRMQLAGDALVRLVDPAERRPAAQFAGVRVHAVAGIGDPERFFRHLEALGLEVERHAFPDHHPYGAEDLEFGDTRPVVMTEKDAVKCGGFALAHWWYLPVQARIDPAFFDFVIGRLRGRQTARDPG